VARNVGSGIHHVVIGDHGVAVLPDLGGFDSDGRVLDLAGDALQNLGLVLDLGAGMGVGEVVG